MSMKFLGIPLLTKSSFTLGFLPWGFYKRRPPVFSHACFPKQHQSIFWLVCVKLGNCTSLLFSETHLLCTMKLTMMSYYSLDHQWGMVGLW